MSLYDLADGLYPSIDRDVLAWPDVVRHEADTTGHGRGGVSLLSGSERSGSHKKLTKLYYNSIHFGTNNRELKRIAKNRNANKKEKYARTNETVTQPDTLPLLSSTSICREHLLARSQMHIPHIYAAQMNVRESVHWR